MNYTDECQCHGVLASIQSLQIALAWSTYMLKINAVYRCREDSTLLDRCAEAQWMKRDNNQIEALMRGLACEYPEFTADWFRC